MIDIRKIARQLFEKIIFMAYGFTHRVEKKIVCMSFFGKQYSDNPKAISEMMHELYSDYEIVWLLNEPRERYKYIPEYVRTVIKGERPFAWGREISTCVAYVVNVEFKKGIHKRKNQLFIQTWHGDRAIKKILFEVNEHADIDDNQVTSICVAGSDAGENLYRAAFRFKGEVLKIGCPRNDSLLKENDVFNQKIKDRIGVDERKKILLYAPTFRDDSMLRKQTVNVDLNRTLSALENNGDEWVCLVRSHAASAGLDIKCDGNRFIDVSSYPDMADILCITDYLLTDYSSCATDFAITGKPVVLILFDEEEYQNQCRDFKIKPEETGFFIAYSQDELEKIIFTKEIDDYKGACKKVSDIYGIHETGEASKIICNYIENFYEEKISHGRKQWESDSKS